MRDNEDLAKKLWKPQGGFNRSEHLMGLTSQHLHTPLETKDSHHMWDRFKSVKSPEVFHIRGVLTNHVSFLLGDIRPIICIYVYIHIYIYIYTYIYIYIYTHTY